jgi:hypothetical protein
LQKGKPVSAVLTRFWHWKTAGTGDTGLSSEAPQNHRLLWKCIRSFPPDLRKKTGFAEIAVNPVLPLPDLPAGLKPLPAYNRVLFIPGWGAF